MNSYFYVLIAFTAWLILNIQLKKPINSKEFWPLFQHQTTVNNDGSTGTGGYSKGNKIPAWQVQVPATNHARRSQARLTDRVYKPDRCKPGYRRRPGAMSLSEIRHYQKTFKFLIAMRPFVRLVREILNNADVTG